METVDLPIQRPKSLTGLAEERIRELIVSGNFALGEQLSEASLAAQLGISKTPVREALLRLRGEGLIDIQPQRGTFVFTLTETQVDEVCRFRELLEVAALAMGMQASLASLVEALDGNVARMSAAHEARDWRALPLLDQEFHEIIVDHCGNPYLQRAYELVGTKIRALRSRLPAQNDRVDHCQENHAVIAGLVRTGDVAGAQQALALHVRDTRDSYLEASRHDAPRLARRA
ncbi:MAG: GntR family transcriptional regulator [Caldimonas sp.]